MTSIIKYFIPAFAVLLICSAIPVYAEIYFEDDFGYTDQTAWENSTWNVDSDASLQGTGGAVDGGKCWYQMYDSSGTRYTNLPVNNTWPEGYIRFYAKLTNKQDSWPKFLKFFGTGCCASDYSNWTLGTANYSYPTLSRISHGGSNSTGDSQYSIKWDQCTTSGVGTINSCSGASFDWPDENWHKFIIYWKLNTNGNADGAYKVWIDGVLQIDISGVVNRNDSNTRSFQKISFGDYTASAPASPYYVWYDEVVVASTYSEADTGTTSTGAPTISGNPEIAADGTTVSMSFSENVSTTGYTSGDMDLDCSVSGNNIALSTPTGSGSSWSFTAASTIQQDETCTLDFNGAANSIEASDDGTDMDAFADMSISNNSTQGTDTTAPIVTEAEIFNSGETLGFLFDEQVFIGTGGTGGFSLSASSGAATLAWASGDGNTYWTYTISRAIQADETVTVSYTQPGDGLEDGAGNDLASFTDFGVSNYSEQGLLSGQLSIGTGTGRISIGAGTGSMTISP